MTELDRSYFLPQALNQFIVQGRICKKGKLFTNKVGVSQHFFWLRQDTWYNEDGEWHVGRVDQINIACYGKLAERMAAEMQLEDLVQVMGTILSIRDARRGPKSWYHVPQLKALYVWPMVRNDTVHDPAASAEPPLEFSALSTTDKPLRGVHRNMFTNEGTLIKDGKVKKAAGEDYENDDAG